MKEHSKYSEKEEPEKKQSSLIIKNITNDKNVLEDKKDIFFILISLLV